MAKRCGLCGMELESQYEGQIAKFMRLPEGTKSYATTYPSIRYCDGCTEALWNKLQAIAKEARRLAGD